MYILLGQEPISTARWAEEGIPGGLFNKPRPHNVINRHRNIPATRFQRKMRITTRHLGFLDRLASQVVTISTVQGGRPLAEAANGTIVDLHILLTRTDPIERPMGNNLVLLVAILSQLGGRRRTEASVLHLPAITHPNLIGNLLPILHGHATMLRSTPLMVEKPAKAITVLEHPHLSVPEMKDAILRPPSFPPDTKKVRVSGDLYLHGTGLHHFGPVGITFSLHRMNTRDPVPPQQVILVHLGIHLALIAPLPLSVSNNLC